MRKLVMAVALVVLGVTGIAYQSEITCAAGLGGCVILTPREGGGDLPLVMCEDTCENVCGSVEGCSATRATDLQTNCECQCSGFDCEDEGGPCATPSVEN